MTVVIGPGSEARSSIYAHQQVKVFAKNIYLTFLHNFFTFTFYKRMLLLIILDHLPKSWSIDQGSRIQGAKGSSENDRKANTY